MEERNNSFRQEGNQLIHTRLLNAPRELVWDVWTKPEHIREWWGPDGFTVTNHDMQVEKGGEWNFIMHGHGMDFDNHVRYMEVIKPSLLIFKNGNDNDPMSFTVYVTFEEAEKKTLMTIKSVFKSAEIIAELNRKVNAIESGKQTWDNLERYVNSQITIRQQLKTNTMARTSTYLNFPSKTEEAFNFYKSVFGGEFDGKGIQRLGDLPEGEGMPSLSSDDKKLILHIQLPILGGHILMGTDAPESMGFNIVFGNNSYINLEPDNRNETKRLFDALSAGGKVIQELQDMFWGAYYGACTDQFGVNWMFNYSDK